MVLVHTLPLLLSLLAPAAHAEDPEPADEAGPVEAPSSRAKAPKDRDQKFETVSSIGGHLAIADNGPRTQNGAVIPSTGISVGGLLLMSDDQDAPVLGWDEHAMVFGSDGWGFRGRSEYTLNLLSQAEHVDFLVLGFSPLSFDHNVTTSGRRRGENYASMQQSVDAGLNLGGDRCRIMGVVGYTATSTTQGRGGWWNPGHHAITGFACRRVHLLGAAGRAHTGRRKVKLKTLGEKISVDALDAVASIRLGKESEESLSASYTSTTTHRGQKGALYEDPPMSGNPVRRDQVFTVSVSGVF